MCKATLKLCQKCAIFRTERILGMKREIESAFSSWKKRNDRKPLVLMGARQVGKSWLMENFGRANFRDIHIFDFVAMPDIASIFSRTKDPNEILPKLEIISGRKIDRNEDVVIFDEIQDCGNALNSLKYFYENCPSLAVMAAGSLLGVNLKKKKGAKNEPPKTYPVGKVEIVNVEPVSFSEFLCEKDKPLWEYYMSIEGDSPLPEIFHRRLWDAYCLYLTIGGMPEVVSSYLSENDPAYVRKLQLDLVSLYENDIVKYNGEIDAAKILAVLRSIVPQLAKENSKFIYGALREGARGRGYEEAIEWLVSARMVRRVFNLDAIEYPLAAHSVRNAFKLYFNDVGMLKVAAGITDDSLILDRDFSFKGRFVENYVLQQLSKNVVGHVHYWAERSDREIDFVIQHESEAIPVEVKAGGDKKAATFKSFVNAKKPRYAIRFSERNLRKDGAFVNIPLYLADRFATCLM